MFVCLVLVAARSRGRGLIQLSHGLEKSFVAIPNQFMDL
jgi:hypothetical protein